MECKTTQKILAATAHKMAVSSAAIVAGLTHCAALQPSSPQVSQKTFFTELCSKVGHALSLSYTHDRTTSSCSFTETSKRNVVNYFPHFVNNIK
jgi:hypothetical protein